MRLFLSSQDFGNYPEVLIRLVGKNKKAAYIGNAKDDWSADERGVNVLEHKKEFEALRFEFEEVDLRGYFHKSRELLSKLSNFGLVWVSGGNTFILRRAMAASGFDKAIRKLLAADKLVYGGSSAGSCVTAKLLRGIDRGDRPHPAVVPKGYPNREVIWDGLGLVPYMIVPHYQSDWFAKAADATIEYLKNHKMPYKVLRDGQVIVIDGGREEFLK